MPLEPGDAPGTRIFVSYSRRDLHFAGWLRDELRGENVEVFQDIEETLPGEEWWARLRQLIAAADTMGSMPLT
jgi:hypothetical protein